MSYSERSASEQDRFGLTTGASERVKADPLEFGTTDSNRVERFLATGIRSRGGPNKESNKLKRSPGSYPFS